MPIRKEIRMKKEISISLIIIIIVVIADILTSNITDKKISDMNNDLDNMREKIVFVKNLNEEDIEKNNNSTYNELIIDVKNIKRKWEDNNNILSYYIEHNELEKVGTEISTLYNYSESNNFEQALDSISRLEFILDHISKKYDFELNNFF